MVPTGRTLALPLAVVEVGPARRVRVVGRGSHVERVHPAAAVGVVVDAHVVVGAAVGTAAAVAVQDVAVRRLLLHVDVVVQREVERSVGAVSGVVAAGGQALVARRTETEKMRSSLTAWVAFHNHITPEIPFCRDNNKQ